LVSRDKATVETLSAATDDDPKVVEAAVETNPKWFHTTSKDDGKLVRLTERGLEAYRKKQGYDEEEP
jgi:hypothetical protein